MKVLFKEDFSDFKPGEFPYDKGHTALGEYHCFFNAGYTGNWYDPISLHQWRSMDGSWLFTSNGSKHFLEQNRGNNTKDAFINVHPCLIIKEKLYADYSLSCNVRPFSLEAFSGVAFNYITSRNLYMFGFMNQKIIVQKRLEEDFTIIEEMNFAYNTDSTYNLIITFLGDMVNFILDGELIFSCDITFIPSKCGVIAKCATRYSDFVLEMTDSNYDKHIAQKLNEVNRLQAKRAHYAPMSLIKKIPLGVSGSGRQIRMFRFEGKSYFILGQHQKRMMRDSFARLSSLSMFDFEGNKHWQIGEADNSFDSTMISCDLPFQVADVNGDGRLELIYSLDFELIIADAMTGKTLTKVPTPLMDSTYPYKRLNVDAIRVADFSGKGYKSDYILKDRYQNVWAFSSDNKLIYKYHHKNTGHFPFIFDFDGDSFDEMFVGYDYVDHDGRIVWSLPMNSDHTDEILYLATKEGEPKRLFLASGNEGFNIVNMDGSIEKHNEIGHAQRISIANYDNSTEDLQIVVSSFWGSDGIVHSYDSSFNLRYTKEQMSNGNVLTPVNYDGENVLCLSNASVDGGLWDFSLDTVVLFPNDGHPFLATEVYDIDDDGIDEILCFDQYEMWIYKASSFKKGTSVLKYPDEAYSNYRGEFLVLKK